MAGTSAIYYGITFACAIIYAHIFIVSKLIQKKWVYFNTDLLIMISGSGIGLILLLVFKINLRDNPTTKDTYNLINIFLLPPMILSDIVSIYEKNLLFRLKPNFFFGVLSTLLNVISTYVVFFIADSSGWLGIDHNYNWQVKLSMSCFFNLTSDTGYRLLKNLQDVELYKIVRERFIINFLIVVGLIYSLRDENTVASIDITLVTLRSVIMYLTSIIIGCFLGATFTLIQNRSGSLRENPMLDMQFVLCFVFTGHFIVQLETDFICDEIPVIFLGLMIAGFSKYNMTPDAVRRFIFLLEIISKLAKLMTMILIGMTLPDSVSNLATLGRVSKLFGIFIPMIMIALGIQYFLSKVFNASSMNYGMKQFFMLYCTTVNKGPLAFILARKYFHISEDMSDEIDLFVFFSMIVFDPLSHVIAYSIPNKPSLPLEVKAKEANAELANTEPKSGWYKFVDFFVEVILSPVLIYNYKRRKDDGEFDKILLVEKLVLAKAERQEPSPTVHHIVSGIKAMGVLNNLDVAMALKGNMVN